MIRGRLLLMAMAVWGCWLSDGVGREAQAREPKVEETLLEAAAVGNHHRVAKLLANGANVDKVNKEKETALMLAIRGEHSLVVMSLLEAGASVELVDKQGNTPLMMAVEVADEAVVLSLLKAKAQLNAVNNAGETALYKAVQGKYYLIVKSLLAAGADPHVAPDGESLLTMAVAANSVGIVYELLEAGLVPTQKVRYRGKECDLSLLTDDVDIQRLLNKYGVVTRISTDEAVQKLKQLKILKPHSDGLYGQFHAAYRGYKAGERRIKDDDYVGLIYQMAHRHLSLPEECLQAFVEAGAPMQNYLIGVGAVNYGHLATLKKWLATPGVDVNSTERSNTVLSVAVENKFEKGVEVLLAVPGIDVNEGNPLGEAINLKYERIVSLLLAMPGIELNENAALVSAVSSGHAPIVKMLLEKESLDINQEGYRHETALSKAVQRGYEDMVRMLLAMPGINVNGHPEDSASPLGDAVLSKNMQIFRMLLAMPEIDVNRGEIRDTPLNRSVILNLYEFFKCLLQTPGIDVNKKLCEKQPFTGEVLREETTLRYAVEYGRLRMVKELVAMPGIDLNAGWPLVIAVQEGHIDILKFLLTVPGLNVNMIARGRQTALHCAAEKGDVEMVKCLLSAPGINVNMTDKEGKTPLQLATGKTAELLRAAGAR